MFNYIGYKLKAVYVFITIISSVILSRAEGNFGYANQSKCQIVMQRDGIVTVIDSLANPDSMYISSIVVHKNNAYVTISPRMGCVRIDKLLKVNLLTKDVIPSPRIPLGINPISSNENSLVMNLDEPTGKGAIYKVEDDSLRYLVREDAFTGNLSISPDNIKLVSCALSGIWIFDFKNDTCKCLNKNISELLAPIWLDNDRFIFYDSEEKLVYIVNLINDETRVLINKKYVLTSMAYMNNRLLLNIRKSDKQSMVYEYNLVNKSFKRLIKSKSLIGQAIYLSNDEILYNANYEGNWNIYRYIRYNKRSEKITQGKDNYWNLFVIK